MQTDFLMTTAALPSGETATIRPMQPDDIVCFITYLERLSAETRARYGPHPFDRKTAAAICATLDPEDILRMAAFVRAGGEERMIAYFLLMMGIREGDRRRYAAREDPLDAETDCTLAPSVADDYQDQGLGSQMMRHVLQCAARLGRKRVALWGGVQTSNLRAVHFYTKFGFRKVGEFYTDKDNDDMILDLEARR
jgi:GNAT superfamily N-acetyltransferase